MGSNKGLIFHSETENHRKFRTKVAIVSGLGGLLSIGLAGLIYFM